MIIVLLASLVVILSTALFFWNRRHLIKLSYTMPHIGWIPFVGGIFHVKGLDGVFFKEIFEIFKNIYAFLEIIVTFSRVFDEIGDMFFTWVGPRPIVLVRDADVVESILSSTKCYNKASILDPLRNILGDGLLSMPGKCCDFCKFSGILREYLWTMETISFQLLLSCPQMQRRCSSCHSIINSYQL